MIVIVDTGGANLASLRFAFDRIGRETELTSDPERITRASHVVLPGVGAAPDSMRRLEAGDLVPVVRGLTQPVLGICLGMQLLFEHSDEGDVGCLGLLPGTVRALTPDVARGITVPHMGWNQLESTEGSSPLFDDHAGEFMYFVHEYAVPRGPWERMVTHHGEAVVAALEHENFFGVQFHPERSGGAGARMLERFANL